MYLVKYKKKVILSEKASSNIKIDILIKSICNLIELKGAKITKIEENIITFRQAINFLHSYYTFYGVDKGKIKILFENNQILIIITLFFYINAIISTIFFCLLFISPFFVKTLYENGNILPYSLFISCFFLILNCIYFIPIILISKLFNNYRIHLENSYRFK